MIKWDYKVPAEYTATSQTDWNQTIVTTFNRVSIGMTPPINTSIPIKFKPIFESLTFYNNGQIDNKFIINFVEFDGNIIYVGDKEFEIINYTPTYKKPPIGLMPRDIHDRNVKIERFNQVCEAIHRYYNESLKIPVEWIEEYNELVDDVKDVYKEEI